MVIVTFKADDETLNMLNELIEYYKFVTHNKVTKSYIIRLAIRLAYNDMLKSSMYEVFKMVTNPKEYKELIRQRERE